jgi:hypothetical protein
MLAVSSEGASTLGAHLAEMDRLLRDIQTELLPEREPAPVLADDAPDPDDAPPPVATAPDPGDAPPPATAVAAPPPAADPQIQSLTELSARLLASIRELLAGYEGVLVGGSRPVRRLAPSRARIRPDAGGVTLSAAPFASLEALHEFEQAVSRLPGVREVAVRGYEGTDRAIIEVRLDRPTP